MNWKSLGVAAVAGATLVGSTFTTASTAEARGGWGGGGFRGGGGFYRGGGGFYRGGYGRRGWGWGGVGAGLAIGALAASAYPYYSGGYYGGGYPYYGGGYYPAAYGYGGGCTIQARRVWGPYGPYIQNVRVCY